MTNPEIQNRLRLLPGVDQLLRTEPIVALLAEHPRHLVLNAIRQVLEETRAAILAGSEGESEPAPNPSELLHTAAFVKLIGQLRERFDHILFDSPPLGAVTDSAIVAPQVDGVILVMKSEKTTRDAAASVMKQLRNVGANFLGGVLNDVDLAKQEAYYGGHYYYSGYYYRSPGDEADGTGCDSAQAAE